MAKKRKAPRQTEPSGPREIDPKEARLTVKTYEDVANSEDEYYAEKDQIDFDEDDNGRRAKRLRRQEKEDTFLEASDEEIFREDDDLSEDDDEAETPAKKVKGAVKAKTGVMSDDEIEGAEGEEEGDEGWWGSSKKEYYNADAIETEADALEEEAEARRIQAKKLAKMQEADFAFDENEWLAPKEQAGDDEDVVIEVLKDDEVTEDMGSEERYKLLQARYPEFDYLVDEFRDLRPVLITLQQQAEGKPAKSLEVVKSWILGCYIASLASYFAILTSPARDAQDSAKPLSPVELREHEVMETLMSCRDAWIRVKALKSSKTAPSDTGMLSPPGDAEMEVPDVLLPAKNAAKAKLSKADIKAREKKEAGKARKAEAAEKSLADLSTLLKSSKKKTKTESAAAATSEISDDNRSDFGEEEIIDARTAEDKIKRKKTLKFYTSQIVQKASRRAGAGRDAGGDVDIPYRERLRDRQARLNAAAEKRGLGNKHGADLGEGDSEGEGAANKDRGEDDEYYDMVAQTAARKKEGKAARFEAIAKATRDDRVVESTQVGADGKRQITYQIQKNKGLAPRRKKEVRNPRVKKRMKYEEKQKKLRTVKATYKGGEGKGGYQGELSGIKTNLVKSTKL
ncbi:Sas10 C-terminal domain-containing protein [Lasiosphaeria hispida]|uniref:Sas10 C-terminal domain-containing protein n=1 Tax=Lasiosphaeria hispida TaxID=260671 RepID=A0AAJ0HMQ7_9PEZI|nr:Sas10 C-terminal domain-containing protein [Lasiosphaeria hispida]